MKRTIITIDEEKCNGCGLCVNGCHEGALQLIDGKARLVSELFCDGLGACIGDCPEGAIKLEEREAQAYDEVETIKRIALRGEKTVLAHLNHLKEHGETEYLKQGIDYLKSINFNIDFTKFESKPKHEHSHGHCACPGSSARDFRNEKPAPSSSTDFSDAPSELRQWPVQLHLVNPMASYFNNADVILAADCVAFSLGNFHDKYLKGKSLAIACPKLDSGKDIYVDKLTTMIEQSEIKSLTVMIMEVPCCMGLLQIAKEAVQKSSRKIEINLKVVGIKGDIK